MQIPLMVFFSGEGRHKDIGADIIEVDTLYKGIFTLLSRSSKQSPSLVGAANSLLGSLCRNFPEKTARCESQVKSALLSQLKQQVNSTVSKVEMPIVEGCLKGLEGSMDAHGLKKDGVIGDIYDILLKVCVKPEDPGVKRTAYRAGLSLFGSHCHVSEKIIIFIMTINFIILNDLLTCYV